MSTRYKFYWYGLGLILIAGCSNTKFKGFKQSVVNFTTYYNSYFNSKHRYKLGYREVIKNKPEKFTELMPIFPYEENTEDFKSVGKFKDIGEKTAKIFTKKKNSKWVDDALLLNGKRFYLSGEYDSAIVQFDYILTHFDKGFRAEHLRQGRPKLLLKDIKYAQKRTKKPISERKLPHKLARNQAYIWLAKSFIRKGDFSEAQRIISQAEADLSFPLQYRGEMRKTQAMLHLAKKEYKSALPYLLTIIDSTKITAQKERYLFIAGQTLEADNEPYKAIGYYNRILLSAKNEDIVFEARLRIAELSGPGQLHKVISDLKKMLNQGRYIDKLDKIYYSIGNAYAKLAQKDEAKENLLKSIANNKNNPNLKFLAYEKLAVMYLDARLYKESGKYYDSALTILPKGFSKESEFKHKANSMIKLSKSIDTFEKNDSILSLVAIGKTAAKAKLAKQLDKEIKERKKEQFIQSTKLEAEQTMPQPAGRTSTFYFDNELTVASGRTAFKRKYGNVKRQDDWKFGGNDQVGSSETASENKIPSLDDANIDKDFIADVIVDNLPFEEKEKNKLIAATQNVIMTIAQIFHYDIKDYPEAIRYYMMLLSKYPLKYEKEEDVYYALYLIQTIQKDQVAATDLAEKLEKNYPESKYLKFIANPGYAAQLMNENNAAEENYKKIFTDFDKKNYNKVITLCMNFIEKNPENKLTPKYKLLKALCHTRHYQFDPYLDQLKDLVENHKTAIEYPTAKEWLDYALKVNRDSIKKIVPKSLLTPEAPSENMFTSKIPDSIKQLTSIAKEEANVNYFFNANANHLVLILVDNSENIYMVKRIVEEALYEKYPNQMYEIKVSRMPSYQLVAIHKINKIFTCLNIAEFIRTHPKLEKYEATIEPLIISEPNLDLMLISGSVNRYREFYKLNY